MRIPRQVPPRRLEEQGTAAGKAEPRADEDTRALLKRIAAPAGSEAPLPRLLLVLAHPDDEVLALGGRLERLAHSRILTVTDGAPADGADARHHGFPSLDAYRAARQEELAAALADAGLTPQVLLPTDDLPPVPVSDQTAAHHLVALSRAVARVVTAFAPEAVLTHPYEGGHPDHDACALAVHAGVALSQRMRASGEIPGRAPLIVETPFYHTGENGSMRTGVFLESTEAAPSVKAELSPEEQENKRRRLACFRSQAETLAQFESKRELFRIAPAYDFTAPPHTGTLFYEQFPWGMSGARFRELAAEALAELFGTDAKRSGEPTA